MKNEINKVDRQVLAQELAKSMYKALRKVISQQKDDSQEIIEDILDPNHIAEVDPDEVESNKKVSVINKNEEVKCKELHKNITKLKNLIISKNKRY